MNSRDVRRTGLLAELLRRRVPQSMVLWMLGTLSVAEGVSLIIESLGAPAWLLQLVVIVALAGTPVVAVFAWRFDLTRSGIRRTGTAPGHEPFRWTRTHGVVAVLTIIALIAGGWFTLNRDRGEILAEGRVAVLPFSNATGDPALAAVGGIAADWITEALVRTSFIQVVDTSTAFLLAGMNPPPAGGGVPPVNAEVFVNGNYYSQNGQLLLQARIVRSDGTLLEALPTVGGPVDDPMRAVSTLREHVLSSLAVHFDPRLESFEGFGGAPPVYAAYEAYVEGLELYMQDAYADAELAFNRAAALDPDFYRARVWAAASMFSENKPGVIDALDEVIALGEGRLSRYDLHHARYFRALGDPIDLREAERQARLMMKAAPGSEDAVREAALSARRVGDYGDAIELFERLDPDRGLIAQWPSYWYNVSRTHLDAGQPEAALAAAQEGIRRHGRFASGFLPLAVAEIEALISLGRFDEAMALVNEVPEDGIATIFLLLKAALRAGAQGNEALRDEFFGRIAEHADWLTPVGGEPLYRRWAKAYVLYYIGWDERAAAVLSESGSGTGAEEATIATTGRLSRVVTLQGLLAARKGNTAGAREALDRLAGIGGDGAALGRARILGLLGNPEAARRALGEPGAAEFEPASPSIDVLPELLEASSVK